MGSTADPISALREHFASTTVKLYAPDAPDYQDIESTFIVRQVKTLGVARPQNAEDVSALVRFCTRNNVEFSVRSGGHDCAGRSKIEDGLLIDMRDIKHVVVAADKATARVGGGILLGDLAKGLETKGLLTPT